jgi:hypothetical protein
MSKRTKLPDGWDESRVKRVLEHYEGQSEEQAVAEGEAVPVITGPPRVTLRSVGDIAGALKGSLSPEGLVLAEEDLGPDFYDLGGEIL